MKKIKLVKLKGKDSRKHNYYKNIILLFIHMNLKMGNMKSKKLQEMVEIKKIPYKTFYL
jgi:hypothetical protein